MLISRFRGGGGGGGEKKAPVNSKQSLPTCNWDPLDNEVAGLEIMIAKYGMFQRLYLN